ncbi:hypothetical protein NP233_g6674 [Leucocoprinus birnbaumii]|uniref:G domain-containing protein n=1 Tax=Leucocoprinus birnbaumii TaxID=56174 RepID=A0AAD5VTE8_9AGAR|nr:hypothetical protein NP233_g6674 [Leucocoprinus birnbaumii]
MTTTPEIWTSSRIEIVYDEVLSAKCGRRVYLAAWCVTVLTIVFTSTASSAPVANRVYDSQETLSQSIASSVMKALTITTQARSLHRTQSDPPAHASKLDKGMVLHELAVHKRLTSLPADETKHCTRLITHCFIHKGIQPDGEHFCLALELERATLRSHWLTLYTIVEMAIRVLANPHLKPSLTNHPAFNSQLPRMPILKNHFKTIIRTFVGYSNKDLIASRAVVGNVLFVSVIGYTGAGITTFIHSLLGSTLQTHSLRGAQSLHRDTKAITPHVVDIPSQANPNQCNPVVLLDTPGIDFDVQSIKKVLGELKEWKRAHCAKRELAGIIFINNPSNDCLRGRTFPAEHSADLDKLCGKNWMSRIVLVNNPHESGNEGFESSARFWELISELRQRNILPTPYFSSSISLGNAPFSTGRQDARENRAKGIYLFDISQAQESAQRILQHLLYSELMTSLCEFKLEIPGTDLAYRAIRPSRKSAILRKALSLSL